MIIRQIPIQIETEALKEYNFMKSYPWYAYLVLGLSVAGILGVVIGMIVTEVTRH